MVTQRARGREEQGGDEGGRRPLAFIDHNRQGYAGHVPVPCEGDFMIGDYLEAGGVGPLGEFKIALHWLGTRHGMLDPQLCVFGDGAGALKELLGLVGDLSALLGPVADHEEFSRRLLELGLRDASHTPLTEEG